MTVQPPPPSGIAGHTPNQIRTQLVRNGWTVLPVVAHDAKHTGAGKAPGIKGWQKRAQFEGPETTLSDLADWQKKERQWPGSGLACGRIVSIDADFATDAALAEQVVALAVEVFGETPFMRQGQAPKLALVYQAAEVIPSISLKAADGSGDGIDVLAESRQLVAYGVHRKTLKPYTWIGSESPLTAGPDAAPEITQAQINAFLTRLRGIVELNGTGGRGAGRGNGGSAQIVRNADGMVVDGREFHLTRTVYAVAQSMVADGAEITIEALSTLAWQKFTASTVLDDARWSPAAAWEKAKALLDRVKRGFVSLDPKPEAAARTAAPTYPDRRVSVAEAEAATATIVNAFFGRHVLAWKAEMAEHKLAVEDAKEREQPEPPKPEPVSWGARVETAIGKTALAIKGAAAAAKAGVSVVYAAPMHSLLTELAERFAAEGVEARIYRGYTTPDPETPGSPMCLDVPAMEDARAAIRPIPSTVCERKDKLSGEKLFCAFHDRCGMERQRQANAPVWLVPHALLFQARPGAIPAPDALVIDEGVTMGALPDKPARMSLDAIERAPVEPSEQSPVFTNFANDLELARGNLLRALRHADQPDGPLLRKVLLEQGVTAAAAGDAHSCEWGRLRDPGIMPGMDAKARKALALTVAQHNQEAKSLAGIWNELRAFLNADAETSGRLSLRYDQEANARILERRSLDKVRASWLAPALLIDATLPDAPLLEAVMGHPVEVKADITAHWSPHVKVRQIVGAPVTARKLGIIDSAEETESEAASTPKRVITDLLRLIHLRAALVWPRIVVVIAPMRLVEKLKDLGLPENVDTAHFGAVAGIDRWARAAGLICIGRLQPGPLVVEPLAGIVTGRTPSTLPPGEHGTWYPRVSAGIRLADGTAAPVIRVHHPDPVAEALRWQITEAGLVQAIGRLRALRRGPDTPAFLDIISDVPLPISVGTVEQWDDAKPGAWAEMASEGVLLEGAADIMACFPEVAPTEKAARLARFLTSALTSLSYLNIGVRASVTRVSYKRAGRFAQTSALVLPNGPSDLRTWLFDRLGAIEWVRLEGAGEPQKAAKPAPATRDTARQPRCADIYPDLAAAYRLVAARETGQTWPAPVIPDIERWRPRRPSYRPHLRLVELEAAE